MGFRFVLCKNVFEGEGTEYAYKNEKKRNLN